MRVALYQMSKCDIESPLMLPKEGEQVILKFNKICSEIRTVKIG
jgi:hypothetical protein